MSRGTPPAAVLLELEGVLVDTRAARTAALVTAFIGEGLPWPATDVPPTAVDAGESPDWATASLDDAVRALAVVLTPAPDPTTLALVALRAEREYAGRIGVGVTLVDGAREVVAALGARARLGVVTSWRRADAERTLALADLDAAVRFVVAADDGVGFADPVRRFARGVARLRGAHLDRPVPAIVASESSATAACGAGAQPVRVPDQVRLGDLTPAWLASWLARAPDPTALPFPRR